MNAFLKRILNWDVLNLELKSEDFWRYELIGGISDPTGFSIKNLFIQLGSETGRGRNTFFRKKLFLIKITCLLIQLFAFPIFPNFSQK